METYLFGWIIRQMANETHQMMGKVFGVTHMMMLIEAGGRKRVMI
jgi:hypothetical protein